MKKIIACCDICGKKPRAGLAVSQQKLYVESRYNYSDEWKRYHFASWWRTCSETCAKPSAFTNIRWDVESFTDENHAAFGRLVAKINDHQKQEVLDQWNKANPISFERLTLQGSTPKAKITKKGNRL